MRESPVGAPRYRGQGYKGALGVDHSGPGALVSAEEFDLEGEPPDHHMVTGKEE